MEINSLQEIIERKVNINYQNFYGFLFSKDNSLNSEIKYNFTK